MKARLPNNYKLTGRERKAIAAEVDRQTAKNVENLALNLMAVYLWQMHEHEGHGKKRLLKDAEDFARLIRELKDFYDFKNGEDMVFLYNYRLKNEVGIDVAELERIFDFKVVGG